MELKLKKTFLQLIIFTFCNLCFCYEFGDNTYELSPLQFNQNVNIVSENIFINDSKTKVQIKLIISESQKTEYNNQLETIISCKPRGIGKYFANMIIPGEFRVYEDDNEINYQVLYKEKKYSPQEAELLEGSDIAEIHFFLNSAKKEINLTLEYYSQELYEFADNGLGYFPTYRFISPESSKMVYVTYEDNSEWKINRIIGNREDENSKWNLETEIEFDIERKFSNSGQLYWGNKIPKDISRVIFEFDNNIIELSSISNSCYLNSIDITKYLINKKQLFFMQNKDLNILRNSIYACHGYNFKNQKWKDYFSTALEQQGFTYKINPNFSESDFNDIERKNIELIREMENLEEPIMLSDFLNENQQ